MTPIPADLYQRCRNRVRIVLICRKPRHARAVLRAMGMPMQPERCTGCDVAILVEPPRRRGDPLGVRVVGRPVNRLLTLLREAASRDAWQQGAAVARRRRERN